MKDHARQALKFFLNSLILLCFSWVQNRVDYFSVRAWWILFFNEGNNIAFCKYTSKYQRYYFVTFCSKNVGCLWGVRCLLCLMELYGLIVFHFQFILNLTRLRKGKRVWVFLTRFQNVAEVRRASQFHCDSMP